MITIQPGTNRQAGAFLPRFRIQGRGFSDRPHPGPSSLDRYITLRSYSLISTYPDKFKAPKDVINYLINNNVIDTVTDELKRSVIDAFRKYNYENSYKGDIDSTFDTTEVGYRLKLGENKMRITKKALKMVIKEEIQKLNEVDEEEAAAVEPQETADYEALAGIPQEIKSMIKTDGKQRFFDIVARIDAKGDPTKEAWMMAVWLLQTYDVNGTSNVGDALSQLPKIKAKAMALAKALDKTPEVAEE